MSTEIVPLSGRSTALALEASALPVLVERAGTAGRFAWEEFFCAEHHNPHTQAAYMRAVKPVHTNSAKEGRFLRLSCPPDRGTLP